MLALERPGGESDALVKPGGSSARKVEVKKEQHRVGGDESERKEAAAIVKKADGVREAGQLSARVADEQKESRVQSTATAADIVRIANHALTSDELPSPNSSMSDGAPATPMVAIHSPGNANAVRVDSDVEEEVARLLDEPDAAS